MNENANKPDDGEEDFSWVEERRSGNKRILIWIVVAVLVVMAYSAWAFIRFMATRS